ncbi:MAG: LuxR C-terminal-related transcriptional regulator [Actinomycetota bacterium]|nr:LuxR C-terminal-related transcriptional regulator [Actinomycetota bacterium]
MAGADETLRAPGVEPMRRIVPMLVNELYEIDDPMVLVLDDYHVLTQERVHASILYLIDHLPPSLCLVIGTRADPPLPLGRLRASGELTEVRIEQLRFSETEAAQLLSSRFDLDMDASIVQVLCHRTEGWPAAIHLAGLSLQGEEDHRGFVERFAGDDRNIADYLTSEALGQLPVALREFLLRTSVLDKLTGALCDAVADVSGSAAILDELERSNLFLIPLDNRRRWYRYHHLFGEWLSHELHRTEPDLVTELHSRASRWYRENGSLRPAITHAIAAGDDQATADLIDQYLEHPGKVHWSALWEWLGYLPDELVEAHPMIATAHVWFALARGDFAHGFRWIDVADSAIHAAPTEMRPRIGRTVALFRVLGEMVTGNMEAARVEFEAMADKERPTGSNAYALAVGFAGIATFWSVGALEAIPALREGSVAREQASLTDGGVTALLAAAYAEIGDWTAAEAAAEAAFAMPPPWEHYRYPDLMAAHYARGKTLIARGEHDHGITQIEQGLELARGWVEPIFVAYGCLALADALDDFAEQRAFVREARQLIDSSQDPGRLAAVLEAAERKLSIRQPSQRTPGTVHVEPLTTRELDVLRLLPSKLSLREIANELYISHNTVKGYTKSIYRKLGVTSRAAAIKTARDLDSL